MLLITNIILTETEKSGFCIETGFSAGITETERMNRMVKEHKKHGRRVLCIFTAAVIAAVSMLCFAGCGSKSTEEKTVSGIITVIADGKYTLQPGTIESTENQFPGGMNDGSRRDGSAPAAPNNNSKISDNDGAEPADSGAKDTNTNDRNDTGKQSEGNPPEGNPPEGNPGSGMNPVGSKISFTENGEAAIEFTVAEGAYIASGTGFVSADKLAVGSIVTVRLNEKNEAQAMIICSAEAGGADAAIPNDPNGQKNTAAPNTPTMSDEPTVSDEPSSEPNTTNTGSVREKN